MNNNVFIERASCHDLDSIVLLFDQYRIFYGQKSNKEQARHFIKNRLTKDESVIFLAKEQENAETGLGFTQLFPSFSSVSMQKIWILNDLYVDQSVRKRGIAKQLMEKAKDFALESEAKSIILETAKDNIPAQRLYDSIGYEHTNLYHYHLDFEKR